jgi:predicted signal transduction protein with EAL and GGDEF domain
MTAACGSAATNSPCCCAARARKATAALLAEKLLEELAQPIDAAGTVVTIGASIGIARFQGAPSELRWLLRRADLAMYEAKNGGKNRCVEFDEQMEVDLGKRAALEAKSVTGSWPASSCRTSSRSSSWRRAR